MKRNMVWIIVAVLVLTVGIAILWRGGSTTTPTMSDTKMQNKMTGAAHEK